MSRSRHTGFSLVELLVTIGVIVLLSALAVPAFNSIARGGNVTMAGDTVAAQLGNARQTAITRNHKVEVRFFAFGDLTDPSGLEYRGMQLVQHRQDGTTREIGKVERLPTPIIISGNHTLSSLVALEGQPDYQVAAVDLPPGATKGFAFRFLPRGGTDLPDASSIYYLTMFSDTAQVSGATPPDNYITVQLDPMNGSVRIYRP